MTTTTSHNSSSLATVVDPFRGLDNILAPEELARLRARFEADLLRIQSTAHKAEPVVCNPLESELQNRQAEYDSLRARRIHNEWEIEQARIRIGLLQQRIQSQLEENSRIDAKQAEVTRYITNIQARLVVPVQA